MHLNSRPSQQQGQGDLQVIYKNKEPGRRPGLLLDLQYPPAPPLPHPPTHPPTPAAASAPPDWHSLAPPWKRAALQITCDSCDDIRLRKPPLPLTGSALRSAPLRCAAAGCTSAFPPSALTCGESERKSGGCREEGGGRKGGEGLHPSELKEFFQQYIDLECSPLISSNASQTAAANPAELRGTLIGNRFPKFR